MNNANTNYWSRCSRHLNVHQLAQKWWLHYALVKDTCMTCCEVNKTTNTRAFLSVWNFLETTYCDMRKICFLLFPKPQHACGIMCACFNKLFLINFLGAFFGSHISSTWWKNERWHVPLDSIFENLVSMVILLKILKFT